MKKILVCLIILLSVFEQSFSQQKLTYSFAENPQTLILNPGAETNYKYHYGIPVFSGFNLNVGTTGVTLEDLFLNNGVPFDTKFQQVLNNIEIDDYVNINARIDILYGGYRLNDRDYLSFGFYNEADIIAYAPKDFGQLFYYGNDRFLNKTFSVSQFVAKADILGVLHVGISRKINRRLNLGARFKIYSSSFNAETNHNSGTFTTFENNTNILRQTLNSIDASVRTSGLVENDELINNASGLLTNTFLGGNFGIGFDFGFTFHATPQLEFTGSIVDFGFVRHSKNVKQYSVTGDYTFDGIDFEFDPANPRDYWQELQDDFDAKVPTEESEEAYTSWRPAKINAALKYSFGEIRRKECFADTHKRYYYNAIGIQVHSVFRPLKPQVSLTGFFETSISEKIHSKFTYTINDYSYTIIGSGMAIQVGKVNLFGFVDNIFKMRDLGTANTMSINFGVNFVIQ